MESLIYAWDKTGGFCIRDIFVHLSERDSFVTHCCNMKKIWSAL